MGNSITSFFKYYVDVANDGVVLNLDLSLRTDLGPRSDGRQHIVLTQDEIRERQEWIAKKELILQHYSSRNFPIVASQEDFLKLRILPPSLGPGPGRGSSRSAPSEFRAHRHYPRRIHVWNAFQSSVEVFGVNSHRSLSDGAVRGVRGSFLDDAELGTERLEEAFLFNRVLQPLRSASLVGTVQMGSSGCQGDPDFVLGSFELCSTDAYNIRIVGETKTTHNLTLPMEAHRVVEQYNAARETVDEMPEHHQHGENEHFRPLGWSNVGHPVAQILGYMVLNQCRYGALTSASRTYFIHIERDTTSGEERVLISDAWYVGQKDYLRAWAFVYAGSHMDNQPRLDRVYISDAWLQGTPEKVRKRRRTDKNADRERIQSAYVANAQSLTAVVPTADLGDFQVDQPIGYGRRGTVFRATWNGETVALKLFDTHKNQGREAFQREMKAYQHLKAAWGRLIPTPKFCAEAFGIVYLGMQLAEPPPPSARIEDWDSVLLKLEEEYGFCHLDVGCRGRGWGLYNRMMLRDDTGELRPIVIDLEDYELVDR